MEEEVPGADLCRVQLLSNSSPQHQPEISQVLEDLGLPESMQSCLHPQMGDLIPKKTWKCFKNSGHPFPTQQKDQVCPCRIVWRAEGCRVWAVPKDPKEPWAGQITPELGAVITLIVWSPSLRLCPLHNKFLIAHESFGMFVAEDWCLRFSLSACQWGQFPNCPEAN